jgi:hypothetical protein
MTMSGSMITTRMTRMTSRRRRARGRRIGIGNTEEAAPKVSRKIRRRRQDARPQQDHRDEAARARSCASAR